MTPAEQDQMQQAIARALRDQLHLPNTEEAGWQAMETAAMLMDVVSAAGLVLSMSHAPGHDDMSAVPDSFSI